MQELGAARAPAPSLLSCPELVTSTLESQSSCPSTLSIKLPPSGPRKHSLPWALKSKVWYSVLELLQYPLWVLIVPHFCIESLY